MRPLHIVFNMSAAGTVRRALGLMGRDEEVVGFIDSLEYGPINPPDIADRARWAEANLDWEWWEELAGDIETFWRETLDTRRERIVWFCPRSVPDYCNFLEWLRRNDGQPCDIVDLGDDWLTENDGHRRLVPCLGSIRAELFVEWKLIERRRKLDIRRTKTWNGVWDRLRQENAPLRVMQAGKLVSVPIDYFDDSLMAHASRDWWRAQFIVGTFLGEMASAGVDNDECPGQIRQTGDILPFARLRALVDVGRLEYDGDFEGGNSYRVRLPQ